MSESTVERIRQIAARALARGDDVTYLIAAELLADIEKDRVQAERRAA